MDPTIKTALRAAYDAATQKTSPTLLDEKREAFLQKYPPEQLASLYGADLMRFVHGDGPRSGLFYDLESGSLTEGFGSIAGGSSLKFKVYGAGDGSGFRKKGSNNDPIPVSDAEAEKMTADLMERLHRAWRWSNDLSLESGDKSAWETFHQNITEDRPDWYGDNDLPVPCLTWAHKYLALARPDLFSFHHMGQQLASHLLRLGALPGVKDARWERYHLDRQWRDLRLGDPDLRDLHPVLLMQAAYETLGGFVNYWRIGTDEVGVDRWPAMKDGGFASVGWAFLGDVRALLEGKEGQAAVDRLRDVMTAHVQTWPKDDQTTPQVIGRWARQLRLFYAVMQPGDRIIAMRGEQWLGVGEVKGEYTYHPGDIQPNHRAVQWHDMSAERWQTPPGFRTTVYGFGDRYADAYKVEQKLQSSPPINVAPEDGTNPAADTIGGRKDGDSTPPMSIVPLDPFEQRVHDILDRKGQVILYGPPGTGKTYNARKAAREILARERAGGRNWGSLTESEKQLVDDAITFVTFHPAYAYEDFIEGYRPTPPAAQASSGSGFEARSGVFVEVCEQARQKPDQHHFLLIDEINRGNVAAVMGELITLLEADKRDTLKVTLPLSRRAFTVPKNLWIIGTMNTADRSISLLDAALRRRFGFVELLPELSPIQVHIEGLSLAALLSEINARIRKYVTRNARELQVGHAYLMRDGQALNTRAGIHAAFRDDILPLLAEYCFENYASLARIVGDEIIDVKGQVPCAAVMDDADKLYDALLRLVGSDPARATNLEDEAATSMEDAVEAESGESAVGEDEDEPLDATA